MICSFLNETRSSSLGTSLGSGSFSNEPVPFNNNILG